MNHQDTILITGGAGFIGAHLIYRLVRSGKKVHVLIRKETNLWRLTGVRSQISLHTTDLLDQKAIKKLVHMIRPSAIVHLAAYGGYHFEQDLQKMVDVNIQSTINLLQASKDVDYSSFIYTGSSSEYGFKKKAMKETDVLEPNSFYAATKASATHICQVFALQHQKPVVTLRPFSVYGPYEEPGRFIPTIMQAVLYKNPIALTRSVARRDFIYVDDVVDAYIAALKQKEKIGGLVFNMGTGVEYTNEEVANMLLAVTKKTVPIQKGAYKNRAWDTKHWVADTTFGKKMLGWQPKHTLSQGLRKTYQWFVKNVDVYKKDTVV